MCFIEKYVYNIYNNIWQIVMIFMVRASTVYTHPNFQRPLNSSGDIS